MEGQNWHLKAKKEENKEEGSGRMNPHNFVKRKVRRSQKSGRCQLNI